MIYLYILTTVLFFISLIKSPQKTKIALKKAWKKFSKISMSFMLMLILISIVFYLIPEQVILKYLDNDSKWISTLMASMLGSVSILPGFIAFPLSGILLKKGVSYMVISAFTTTLMMVGVVTFPIEKAYLGTKVTIIRNVVAIFTALTTAIVTGLIYGELL